MTVTGTKNLQMGGVVVVNFIGSLSQQVLRVVWPPIIESPFVHYGRLVSTRLSIGTLSLNGARTCLIQITWTTKLLTFRDWPTYHDSPIIKAPTSTWTVSVWDKLTTSVRKIFLERSVWIIKNQQQSPQIKSSPEVLTELWWWNTGRWNLLVSWKPPEEPDFFGRILPCSTHLRRMSMSKALRASEFTHIDSRFAAKSCKNT